MNKLYLGYFVCIISSSRGHSIHIGLADYYSALTS